MPALFVIRQQRANQPVSFPPPLGSRNIAKGHSVSHRTGAVKAGDLWRSMKTEKNEKNEEIEGSRPKIKLGSKPRLSQQANA
jgi:hypothetical protein